MPIRNMVILMLAVALGLPLFFSGTAQAIPAFTRQHKTECSTCHTIYPELNEYGEAFLKNSYVYSNKKAGVTSPVQVNGAAGASAGSGQETAADKTVAGVDAPDVKTPPGKDPALWLAAIPEMLPVSLTASLNLAHNDHAKDKFDLTTRALVLQAGGTFRDKAGFYTSYNLYSEGTYDPQLANVPGNNNPNLNELFFVWRHLLDSPVNVRVGRFKPKLSLWKSTNKTTVASFAPQVYKVGSSQFSLDSAADGVEVNSIVGNRFYVAAGVIDRNDQNEKEGYGHVSFKIGGSDFKGEEPEIDLDSDSIWDFMALTVGTYGYYGRYEVSTIPGSNANYYYRAGLDADLSYKRLRTRISGVYGRDSNPSFAAVPDDVKSLVMAAEAEYLIGSTVIAVVRYEYQDDGTGIHNRVIPAIAYAPLQNTKLVLEYKNDNISYHGAPSATDRITQLALAFSF